MKVRQVLTSLAAALSGYLAARGIFPTQMVDRPGFLVAGVAVYLLSTLLVLAVPSGRRDGAPARLPRWTSAWAVLVSAALPCIVSASSERDDWTAPHVTWYIGAVGALMTIVMVRRRPVWAWGGIVAMSAASSALIGLGSALSFGLVGSVLWVAVAQLMQLSTDRAYADTVKLASLQQASAAWQSAQMMRRRERRERVQYALEVAGPVLTQVIASGGALADEERNEAWIAEGTLRDELRAPKLMDDEVRAAIAGLRRRGATVTVLDEGGVDDLDEAQLATVRAELAATLAATDAPRLIIRAAPHPEIAVTVVGRAGVELSDEDAVALWHEIPRPS
ncbi:hypothetical protein QWJ90_03320 [Microbacterium oryzae]|uniref:hypothetical protein n=1 Tax=Microbacterium oryzae TaxID=743009 RepID=UPI0025B2733B|nr:hypothetical protein [Microbacterium oryzae]MDN3309957.1 hypothetical protein [Microbacterium oryzae]